jgi:uncharacterized membrane protein (DUF373 family)
MPKSARAVAPGEPRLSDDPKPARALGQLGKLAERVFAKIESVTYFLLGGLFLVAVAKGMLDAALQLFDSLGMHSASGSMVFAIDRLLLVMMLVEILHTVGVSFRSHSLTPEPFLVVALIASIRRMLVVTLESSQFTAAGRSSAEGQALLHAAMVELVVLGLLILIMVISIVLLRRTRAGVVANSHNTMAG